MAEVISVSALNRYVRSILEGDEALGDIAISGEISNFNRNFKTGHCYFSLKDEKAGVKAVMFRSDAERLAFEPENGMRVVARGRVTLYERDGAFQVYVEYLFPDGVGAAQMAFEQLKARLAQEGLFEMEAKKLLPQWPGTIGLVTSKTGAALQDILNVAQRRCPLARFLLVPVAVQGEGAPPQVEKAIHLLDEQEEVDLIIVARGGGSAEDLWVFNAESIARAAFACKTPIISAIGHEIDYTILDFVADVRAPTPSAAAEIALPDLAATQGQMMNVLSNISNNIQNRLYSWYNVLGRCRTHPALAGRADVIAGQGADLQRLRGRLADAAAQGTQRAEERLKAAAALAAGLNPYSVLARGYAVAKAENRLVKSVDEVKVGDKLELLMQDGRLAGRCEEIIKGREAGLIG